MTHASVFSGIGGPEIAAAMLGWENLFHCEINPFGRKILEYWFPKSVSYEDITTTDFTQWRGKINVLSGGFPCQPFSYAGQRRGAEDDRYLWPYMFRCIDQIRPDWVIAENVAGVTTMVEQGQVSEVGNQTSMFGEDNDIHGYRLEETFTIERICNDLESHGYTVQPILVPACSVGAPHRRDRVFIIGHIATDSYKCTDGRKTGKNERENESERLQERYEIWESYITDKVRSAMCGTAADTNSVRGRKRRSYMESEITDGDELVKYGWERTAADTESQQGGQLQLGQRGSGEQRQTQSEGRNSENSTERIYADSDSPLLQRWNGKGSSESGHRQGTESLDSKASFGRWDSFPTVSPIHRGNDGIPFPMDSLTISFSKWRTESLKAYGNAIVPQVVYEIFRAIEFVENERN